MYRPLPDGLTIKNSPIVLQFPLMLCWGVNERVDENSGRVSYDLSLDFRNETSATRAMLANLKKFEKRYSRYSSSLACCVNCMYMSRSSP